MFITLELLPFLAAPFFLPGIAGGYRFGAFLIVAGFVLVRLIQGWVHFSSPLRRIPFSPLHLSLWFGVLCLYFSFSYTWNQHVLWPAAVFGTFLLVSLSGSRISPLLGFGATALVLWGIYIFQLNFDFFPNVSFGDTVRTLFPASNDPGVAGLTVLSAPVDSSSIDSLKTALLCTVPLFFAVFFTDCISTRFFLQFLFFPILLCACAFFLGWMGSEAYLLLCFTIIIFILFKRRETIFPSKNEWIAIGLILFIGAVGYFDYFTPLLFSITQPFFQALRPFEFPLPAPLFSESALQSFWGESQALRAENTIGSIVSLILLLIVLEKWNETRRRGSVLPLSLSILVFTVLSAGFPVIMMLSHPLLWLSIGVMQRSSPTETIEEMDDPHLETSSFLPIALSAVGGILILLSCNFLFQEWRADHVLKQVRQSGSEEKRVDLLRVGFKRAPYRADLAALYATARLRQVIQQGTMPDVQELRTLETAFIVSARREYILFQAYQNLSDLFFYHGDPERSLEVLTEAVKRFPDQAPLHELRANRLDLLGHYEEALQAYQICAQLQPSSPHYREKLAQAYKSLGREADYRRERLNLLTLDPFARLE